MAILASAATSLYLTFNSGQVAGMDNVLLRPKATLGITQDFSFQSLPELVTRVDIYSLMGSAETGDGTSGQRFQEIRANATSLYRFYLHEGLSFSGGLYSEFAIPLHNYTSLYAQSSQNSYALEENEKLYAEHLLGADLNTAVQYDRLSSSMHTVMFFEGARMGPNLLAYKPLLGFDWTNRVHAIGDADNPKLDLYVNTKFWFARKGGGANLFNAHDGLAGTKREIDITLGVGYHLLRSAEIYVQTYGYNNINRGTDASKPQGYTDGFMAGIKYSF